MGTVAIPDLSDLTQNSGIVVFPLSLLADWTQPGTLQIPSDKA